MNVIHGQHDFETLLVLNHSADISRRLNQNIKPSKENFGVPHTRVLWINQMNKVKQHELEIVSLNFT